jgi:hypothetical protein
MEVWMIVGRGRSGSTLIGNVLNEISYITHVGELRYVWDISINEGRECACGKKMPNCSFWSPVYSEIYNCLGEEGVNEASIRSKRLPTHTEVALKKAMGKRININEVYLNRISKLYKSIGKYTKSKVILDSSKFPVHAMCLQQVPEINLSVIHLVRDPREVAESWMSKKEPSSVSAQYMPTHGHVKESFKWTVWNKVAESIVINDRYIIVRYEEFCKKPQSTIDEIISKFGKKGEKIITDKKVHLGENHSLWGNPSRKLRGKVKIENKNKGNFSAKKIVVNMMCRSSMKKYGYQF